MNVNDFIQRNGQKVVANPAFNPRSKKNVQPRSLIVPDIELENDAAINMAVSDYINQYFVDSKDVEKYRKAGFNWNPNENLDNQLADTQSTFNRIWNAGKQLLWSELVLGSGKGFSDIVGGIINLPVLLGSKGNYENPVSDWFEEKINNFNEDNPIYIGDNQNFFDVAISHIPAVGGMASMLIPVAGTAKAISWLGRGIRIGKGARATVKALSGTRNVERFEDLNRVQQFLNANSTINATNIGLGVAGNAILNRAMWSYSDARGVHNETYLMAMDKFKNMDDVEFQDYVEKNIGTPEGVDTKNKDDVAKYIATKSADAAFDFDKVNILFDVVQMWGLRNVWTGVKNAKLSPALRKQQREDIMFAGKTPEEIKAIKDQMSVWTKAKYTIGDYTIGNKPLIYSQLAGGAQMGIVHIGHLEGINVGQVLLEEKPTSTFDTRLTEYLSSPELYEDTAWGMVAGTVFHIVGSKIRQGFNTAEHKIDERNRAKKAGEENVADKDKKATGWSLLDELPEIKRRRTDMQNRAVKVKTYIDEMERISKDQDPFNLDKKGGFGKLNTDAERESARRHAEDKFIYNITLDAAANGNLKWLKEYIASDEIRQHFVDKKLFGEDKSVAESESKQLQTRLLEKIDKIDKAYDAEIYNIGNHLNAIGFNRKKSIPIQYAQIIAKENLEHKINVENVRKYVNDLDGEISTRISNLIDDGKVDSNNNIRYITELSVTTAHLGQLYAEKERLIKTKQNDTSTTTALNKINSQINILEDRIESFIPGADRGSVQHLAGLLFAKSHAKGYEYKEGETIATPSNPERTADILNDLFITTEENLKTLRGDELSDFLNWDLASVEADLPSIRSEYMKIRDEVEKVYDDNKGVKAIDSQLATDLTSYAHLRNVLEIEKNSVNETREELTHRVNSLDNFFDVQRVKIVQKALDTITTLQKKYDKPNSNVNIAQIFSNLYDGYKFDDITSELTDTEKIQFKEAVEILDLANDDNKQLVATIQEMLLKNMFNNILEEHERTRTTESPTDTNDITQNPSASGKPISEVLNNGSSVISSEDANRSNGKENGQINKVLAESGQPIVTNHNLETTVLGDGSVEYKVSNRKDNSGNISLRHVEGTEDQYELIAPTTDGLDKRILSNDDFFVVGEDGALPMDGAVVDVNPIVRLNKDNTITVINKGVLKANDGSPSTDNSSTGELPAINSKPATGGIASVKDGSSPLRSNEEGITPPASQFDADNAVSDADKVAGTAGLFGAKTAGQEAERTPLSAAQEVDPETGKSVMSLSNVDIKRQALSYVVKAKNENLSVVSSELRDRLIKQFVKEGTDDEASIREQIDISVKWAEQYAARQGLNTIKDSAENIINNVVLRLSSIKEQSSTPKFEKAFTDAVDKLMKKYSKDVNGDVIDGKSYIKLEDLLRYCNEHSKNPYTAQVMYETFVKYLKTEDAQSKYKISDIRDADNNNVLTRAMRNQERRFQEIISTEEGSRLNTNEILDVLEKGDKQEYAKISEVIFNAKVGDDISISVNEDGRIVFKLGEHIVGNLPTPKIDASTGAYYQVNKDVVSDVLVDGNGNIYSKLKDRLSSWLDNYGNDEIVKALNDILIEYKYANKDRRKELLEDFQKNKEVQKAIVDKIIKAASQDALEHLSNIWNYTKQFSGVDVETTNRFRSRSLDLWFRKLNNSYTTMSEIGVNPSKYSVKVSRITDGEIIRNTDTNDAPIPVSKAIGRAHKGQVRIAAVDNYDPGYLNIAGIGKVKTNLSGSSTVIVIPNRRGGYEEVHAYGQPLNSENFKGNSAGEIVQKVKDEIAKHLKASVEVHKYGDVEEAYNKLETLLNSLFASKGADSLFKGIKLNTNSYSNDPNKTKTGFTIYNNRGESIRIGFKKRNAKTGTFFESNEIVLGKNDVRKITIDNIDKTIEDVVKFITDNSSFNLAFGHIKSDSNPNINLPGVASRSFDGKFNISIGDKVWKFDSYNDFILNNDVVNVNTHPDGQGFSNFNRRGIRHSSGNQTFNVSFQNRDGSSPIEKVKEINSSQSLMDKVYKAIQNNGKKKGRSIQNTGREVASILMPKTKIAALKNPKSGISLFPNDIVYAEDFNTLAGYEDAMAATNTTGKDVRLSNGQIIKPGQVVVGKIFMDMISDPNRRWEAPYKLIHEQIHTILHKDGNEKFVEQVREVYDEFVKANEEAGIEKHTDENPTIRRYEFDAYKDKDGKLTEDGLEEFLVESLTSKTLADRLNEINREDMSSGISKKKSLLQKIMDIINKAFGWNVREGSLREKEFEALRDFIETERKKVENKEEIKEEIQTETKAESEAKTELPLVTPQKPVETIVEVPKVNNPFSRNRGKDNKFRKASVEESLRALPSLNTLRDEMNFENKEKLNDLVRKGIVSISCK